MQHCFSSDFGNMAVSSTPLRDMSADGKLSARAPISPLTSPINSIGRHCLMRKMKTRHSEKYRIIPFSFSTRIGTDITRISFVDGEAIVVAFVLLITARRRRGLQHHLWSVGPQHSFKFSDNCHDNVMSEWPSLSILASLGRLMYHNWTSCQAWCNSPIPTTIGLSRGPCQ